MGLYIVCGKIGNIGIASNIFIAEVKHGTGEGWFRRGGRFGLA